MSCHAAAQTPAAPYQRMRTGADSWNFRGGYAHSWHGGYGAYGGYFAPYYAPPIIAGSWYERPYPYHFDYYRYRWGGSPNGTYGNAGVEMIPAEDCPCLQAVPKDEAVVAPGLGASIEAKRARRRAPLAGSLEG
jgi:hypothetical protein